MPEDASMVTTEEAKTYFAGRLYADAWDTATETNKVKALTTATRHLDALPFWGTKADVNQAHAFPRCYLLEDTPWASDRFIPNKGWVCEDAVPQAVKDAVCEQALFLLEQTPYDRHRARGQAAGVNAVTTGSASESVDPAQVTKGQWGPRLSPEATRLLSAYVASVVDIG